MNEKEEYRSPEGVEPIGKNKQLGQFLVHLDELADSLAEPFARPDLTKFTLKLSVVGGSGIFLYDQYEIFLSMPSKACSCIK